MKRATTQTFVAEFQLRTTPAEERRCVFDSMRLDKFTMLLLVRRFDVWIS
jgi:hypothetical protein